MRFKLARTSDNFSVTYEEKEIEFNTLEELLDFVQKEGEEVIVTPPNYHGVGFPIMWQLEIYDDYREWAFYLEFN